MPPPPLVRRIFCNRTLNLRSIRAIGYDMDYTLIHYRIEEWERLAYEHVRQRLLSKGWPVEDLAFEPELVVRGLILDLELGNAIKANRFGYVKSSSHGTRRISFDEQKRAYARTLIDLAEKRWVFLNTLFSISEACLYMQLVDKLDSGDLAHGIGYADLYAVVKKNLDRAHLEGELKEEIVADPERFVDLDPEAPLALLDQRRAGKKLLLITNSEWRYTRAMMSWAFDRFLPEGTGWRDLFDVVIVAARKPGFFEQRRPLYEVVDEEEGLLKPAVRGLAEGGNYHGGHAGLVEKFLGSEGDRILYVGDHILTDVKLAKSVLRWRVALILRELEEELEAHAAFVDRQRELNELMADKQRLEHERWQLRLAELRLEHGAEPPTPELADGATIAAAMTSTRSELEALDARIKPLAREAGELGSPRWGLLLRTGNDKSHLARQVERHADLYTSRVSNFLFATPFVYFRSPRGSLPHDAGGPIQEAGIEEDPGDEDAEPTD